MRKCLKILCLALACLMLCSCTGQSSKPVVEEKSGELPRVAYVPLDNRPNNAECMEYLAQSLGYELAMPEEDLFATKLNKQPLNSNGSPSGNRAAIYEWLLEQEKNGCDRYIIFTDQLMSGGLVNSRAMNGSEPVTLSDGTVMTEEQLMESVVELLGSDGNNRVFMLDTVMRLAPTVGYKQWTMDDYNNVRAWACVPRIECDNNPQAITAGYRTDIYGEEIYPDAYGVSESVLNKYLQARERKMQLSCCMLDALDRTDGNVFSVLMGIDDSTEENCIQKNEILYFENRLGTGDALLSGVDDMGYKALTKLYLNESAWQGCDAEVHYFGENENKPASAFDFRALNEIMDAHFDYFGLKKSSDAQLCFLVLTTPKNEADMRFYLSNFLSTLDAALAADKAIVLMDASYGVYGNTLRNELLENTELGKLISYGGLLDLANLTGVAVSHGVSRYAFLQNGEETDYTQRGFQRCMADVLVKDLCYRQIIRYEASQYATNVNGNADNFYDPKIDEEAILDYAVNRMNQLAPEVLDNLKESNFITGLEPYAEAGWGGIELTNYRFPWHRTFELAFDVNVGNATKIHK